MKKFSILVLTGALLLNTVQVIPHVRSQESTSFSDVSQTQENAPAIEYLKEQGVVKGYTDGTFRPESQVNRAEFMKMVVELLAVKTAGSNCFTDVKNEWFAPYICTAKNLKIVGGYADGTFHPEKNISFAEASKIVTNALQLQNTNTNSGVWYQGFVDTLANKKAIPLSVEYFDEDVTRGELSEILWRLKTNQQNVTSRSYTEIAGEGFAKINSCQELQDRFEKMQSAPYPIPLREGALDTTAVKSSEAPASAGTAAPDYSQTNIQVAGVDEADIIKNDGQYIYLIKGNTIRIIEAYPAENMRELAKLKLGEDLSSFYPMEMYLDQNQLVVIGNTYNNYYGYPTPGMYDSNVMTPSGFSPNPSPRGTVTYILDITNKQQPTLLRSIQMDGTYQTSRRIGNNLYLISNHYAATFPVPYYFSRSFFELPSDINNTNTNINADPADFLPKMKDSRTNQEEKLVDCNQVIWFPHTRQPNFLITAAIPLADPSEEISRQVLVANGDNVYVSQNSLYVASTDFTAGFAPEPAYVHPDSVIYKFALTNGKVEFKNKGVIPGRILNQFSMDEYNGNLRVATIKDGNWWGDTQTPSVSGVYVLDENMKTVGKVEGIAPGEQMYAARFMGDRGYLVTFQQIDPLFVLNLQDPKNPKLQGELKIPGYSNYLQPYDATHLLGFGNEVDASIDADKVHDPNAVYYTAVQGLKLALFDVSDINNPKELFKEVIGDRGSTSDVLYNHKALLFDKEKNLLALPVTETKIQPSSCDNYSYNSCPTECQKICVPSSCTLQNGVEVCTTDCAGPKSCIRPDYEYPKTVFQGAYVYTLDLAKGFQLRGKITHYGPEDDVILQGNYVQFYDKTIQRILYIGENLYTVSPAIIKVNDLQALAEKKTIELAGE